LLTKVRDGRASTPVIPPLDYCESHPEQAHRLLYQRIGIFTALPLRSLDHLTLPGNPRKIGFMEGSTIKPAAAD
jgi:hypothetical protein